MREKIQITLLLVTGEREMFQNPCQMGKDVSLEKKIPENTAGFRKTPFLFPASVLRYLLRFYCLVV
jgi:hypothetical protein